MEILQMWSQQTCRSCSPGQLVGRWMAPPTGQFKIKGQKINPVFIYYTNRSSVASVNKTGSRHKNKLTLHDEMNIWHWKCVQSEAERSVFEAAVRRSVQFGEAEQLDGIEGELPAADVLQHVFHPAAVPAHTDGERFVSVRPRRPTQSWVNGEETVTKILQRNKQIPS